MKGSTLLAFLAGATIGAAIALLATPVTGEQMRQKIKERYKRYECEEEEDELIAHKVPAHHTTHHHTKKKEVEDAKQ